jgi:membrane protease YdiL (CAAX protease family)
MKRINKTWLFIIIVFTISFSLAGLFKLLNFKFIGIYAVIFGFLYMFLPTLSVLFVEKVVYKEKIRDKLLISFKINKWFIASILFPILLAFGAMGISLLFPQVFFSPDMEGLFKRFQDSLSPEQIDQMRFSFKAMPLNPVLLTTIQGVIAGLTINAVAGFGEELGWRGFLLNEFKGWRFSKVSIVVGAIWGFWHAPLILMGHNYPQHPQFGVFMMVIWCILLTFIFNYVTIKSKSVIAAAAIHGVLNGTAGISVMLLDGGNDLTIGITGFAGFISLAILISIVFVYDYWISKDKVFGNTIEKSLGLLNN